ncbi:hypothetical protein [Paenibacillus xerothermodurans]|uniref:Uncharacterized protein n=1 Tax=Paenibacillus xerothermodurans TaxID=1977292 RepID=A0A2W1NDE0_PAEXE|nr:hypothetical protein [Paenibacillus xerothermodurans]PZE21974.1 hypothetical protein CBW46_006135 [Paenibacillus xerothermodurans]
MNDRTRAVNEHNQKEAAPDEKDDTFLPPRRAVHPTEKETWLRMFYRSLLWLFIMLVTGLLVWGWQSVSMAS